MTSLAMDLGARPAVRALFISLRACLAFLTSVSCWARPCQGHRRSYCSCTAQVQGSCAKFETMYQSHVQSVLLPSLKQGLDLMLACSSSISKHKRKHKPT